MKKLVFILSIVVGLAVNAGTVDWTAYDDNGTAATDLLIYIFEGDLTSGTKIDAITDSATAATYVSGALASGLLVKDDDYYGEGSTAAMTGGSHTFYAVLFDSDTVAGASNYQVFGAFNVNVPGSGAGNLDMDLTGLTSSGWTAVSGGGDIPEPTSGLLLLIGGAMLALRRKQK